MIHFTISTSHDIWEVGNFYAKNILAYYMSWFQQCLNKEVVVTYAPRTKILISVYGDKGYIYKKSVPPVKFIKNKKIIITDDFSL